MGKQAMRRKGFKDVYAFQHPDFALGNFINCTPAIRALAEITGGKIDTVFSSELVASCFEDCPFINRVESSNKEMIISSKFVCPDESMPDYQYVWKRVFDTAYDKRYRTYVDEVVEQSEQYAVFINGTGVDADIAYTERKDPHTEIYHYAKDKVDLIGLFVGSKLDVARSIKFCTRDDIALVVGMREALSAIAQASFIISNDSGLAHAAAAMNKPLLVIWKDTKKIKNQNAGKRTQYTYKGDWENGVDKFFRSVSDGFINKMVNDI